MENTKVLLVEDSQIEMHMISHHLEKHHEVFKARTISEAKKLIEKKSFDAVVLDLNLEDSEGVDSFTKMKEAAGEDTPIVVYSGICDPAAPDALKQAGCDSFYNKSGLTPEMLHVEIVFAIEKNKHARQICDDNQKDTANEQREPPPDGSEGNH